MWNGVGAALVFITWNLGTCDGKPPFGCPKCRSYDENGESKSKPGTGFAWNQGLAFLATDNGSGKSSCANHGNVFQEISVQPMSRNVQCATRNKG